MDSEFAFMLIFFGIVLGVVGAFLLILIRKKKFKKKALEMIKKQDAENGEDRTPTDFWRGIKQYKPKEETKKVEEKKPEKKVRVKEKKPEKKTKVKKTKSKKKRKGKK